MIGNNVVLSTCRGATILSVGSAKSMISVVLNVTTFGANVDIVEFLSIFKKYVASGIYPSSAPNAGTTCEIKTSAVAGIIVFGLYPIACAIVIIFPSSSAYASKFSLKELSI